MPPSVWEGSGNVFKDLVLPDADRLLAEADERITRMQQERAARDYCPACLHCNPPPEPNFPMPRYAPSPIPDKHRNEHIRERMRLEDMKAKRKRW